MPARTANTMTAKTPLQLARTITPPRLEVLRAVDAGAVIVQYHSYRDVSAGAYASAWLGERQVSGEVRWLRSHDLVRVELNRTQAAGVGNLSPVRVTDRGHGVLARCT